MVVERKQGILVIKQGRGGQKLPNKKAGERDTVMVVEQRLTGSWRGNEMGRGVEK